MAFEIPAHHGLVEGEAGAVGYLGVEERLQQPAGRQSLVAGSGDDVVEAEVWGAGHHGTLRTIDNFLLQLRTKLESDPAEPEHLLTVRGVGYRFKR